MGEIVLTILAGMFLIVFKYPATFGWTCRLAVLPVARQLDHNQAVRLADSALACELAEWQLELAIAETADPMAKERYRDNIGVDLADTESDQVDETPF